MLKTILYIAIPAAVKHLLDMVLILIDMIMVGSLGVDHVAAVGLGLQFMMVLGVVMTIYSVGGNAVIARLKGSGRIYKANITLYNLSLIVIVLAVVSMLFVIPLSKELYIWMQVSDHVAELGSLYFGTIAFGFIVMFFDTLFFTYFSAMGNTVISLYIKIASALVNVFFNYGLIFGHFGMPALGVQGAAIATIIALSFNVAAYAFWLYRSQTYGMVRLYSQKILKEVWKIGYPASVERGIASLSFMLFVAIIAGYSTQSLAGYQIGLRIEGIAFMPGFGFSVAAMTLMGQRLGAKDPKGAEEAVMITAWIAAAFMGFVGIFMFFFPEVAIVFFTNDARTIDEAATYLRLVGVSQVPLAMMFVLSSGLRGAGAVRLTMIVSLSTLWSLRILPAYLASYLSDDILWVYVVMTIETFVKGGLFFYLFKKGSWKKIKLKV
jgi:putative MATE family efflux protein